MSRWIELAELCEAADGPDVLLDKMLTHELYPGDRDMQRSAEFGSFRPSKSLDAAMHFVPLGHWFLIGKDTPPKPWARCYDVTLLYDAPEGYGDLREAATPALALCAACCRAIAHQQQSQEAPVSAEQAAGDL